MNPLNGGDERQSVKAALDQFVELGGTEFMVEMVDLLRNQTPDQFCQIDDSLKSSDLTVAQRQAHSMKSSFGNFGASECQRLATAMDAAGKTGDRQEYEARYCELQRAYSRLQALIDELIQH